MVDGVTPRYSAMLDARDITRFVSLLVVPGILRLLADTVEGSASFPFWAGGDFARGE